MPPQTLPVLSANFETLEFWAAEPLRVIRLNSKRYKVVGIEIFFDLIPAHMRHDTTESKPDTRNPLRLNTKNREIVIQGENAAKLSETEWLLIHRLYEAGRKTGIYALTIDQLCDPEQGEALWGINDVPTSQTLRNLAYNAGDKLTKANIFVPIRFSAPENGFSMTITNEIFEESPDDHQELRNKNADEIKSKTRAKKTGKRDADAGTNS